MATPRDPRDDESDRPNAQGTEAGRRRARLLIPAAFLAALVLVFVFMVVVSQLNQ